MVSSAAYFSDEPRALARRSEGALTMADDTPGDFEALFHPPTGALEVIVKASAATIAWEYLFLEDVSLTDRETAVRLLAICDSILVGAAISKRSGSPIWRRVETVIPLTTRGIDMAWRDRSTVFFDFGHASQASRQA